MKSSQISARSSTRTYITTGDGGLFYLHIAVSRVHYAVFLYRTLHRNDPIDPANPERPLPEQLTTYPPEYLESDENRVAFLMLTMMGQTVTNYPADYLITVAIKGGPHGDKRKIEYYSTQFGKHKEMAKQNILYLQQFSEDDSAVGKMLKRWLTGEFSQVINDYKTLRGMTDDDYGNWDVCKDDFLEARTKRAEEYFLRTLSGEEAVKRHRSEWGTKQL